ncbi:hypothetical protein QJQ45_005222 [Haematococcus lacustris]|nr:hypothetical protein QJQ45_005222 [Haematococcus lacustris]
MCDNQVFTVAGREVCLESTADDCEPTVYSMLRSWVRNQREQEAAPEKVLVQLPKRADCSTAGLVDPAPPVHRDDTYCKDEPQLALHNLKMHWVSVRCHFQKLQSRRAERQGQRLRPLLMPASGVTAPMHTPLPQHHMPLHHQ